MSSLPPNVIASALQTALQQRQVNQVRSAGDRRETDMSQAIARAAEQHESQIENTDADGRVHPDGSGGGGQGRAFSEHPQPESQETQEQAPAQSITTDADGRVHLDITA